MRLLRRHAAPLAVALPIVLAGLVAGTGTTPMAGGSGSTVTTVVRNGPLGAGPGAGDPSGSADPSDRFPAGAHPAGGPAGPSSGPSSRTPYVRPAVARTGHASADVSDTALPAQVLVAYRNAATVLGGTEAGCNLEWPLLAGIGRVESGHANGGAVDRDGRTLTPILGPVLDGGPGVSAIADSDDGRWDTDDTWDRAVGPMQFIPTSWVIHGADGNGDGSRDPHNVRDAALASAGYLCTGDRDVGVERDRRLAVFSYNHSWEYVDLVLAWADAYAGGTPVLAGSLPVPAAGSDGGRSGDGVRSRLPEAQPSSTPKPSATPSSTPTPGATSVPAPTPSAEPARTPAPGPSAPPTPTSDPSPSPDPGCPTPSPSSTPTGSPTPTSTSTSPSDASEPTPTPSPTQVEATPTSSPAPTPTPTDTCGQTAPGGSSTP